MSISPVRSSMTMSLRRIALYCRAEDIFAMRYDTPIPTVWR